MQTRTYNFYSAASQNNAASIQILAPGYIHMVCWSVGLNMIADNDGVTAELGFQSTLQSNTHNSIGLIDSVRTWINLLTSGAFNGHLTKVCSGLYIPVGVGQIVYLNTSIGAGAAQIQSIMHVIER